MNALRVAYVLARPPGYSETFIGAEVEAVKAQGAQVEVFTALPPGDGRRGQLLRVLGVLAAHPVKVLRHLRLLGFSYGMRGLLASACALRLVAAVKDFRPHVVHTHFVNLPTAIALLVAHELKVPSTALAHAADFLLESQAGALSRRLARLSHLFVISAAAAQQLRDLGVDLNAVPHSVARAAYDGRTAERAARQPGRPRLVTIARLIDKKGVDTTITAVAILARAGVEVRYDVFGDGPQREALLGQIAREGVAGRVTLHGAVGHQEAMAALGAAEVAVLACRRAADGDIDGIPVFLMEAASRGVPVVTTAVSGIPELVGEDCGWLARPQDPMGLAVMIRSVLEQPEQAELRVKALRERIATEFSPQLQAQRLLATWQALVGRPR